MQKVVVIAALVVVAIQLVPVPRDNPSVVEDVSAPEDVKAVLRRACYDCHSNQTRWPWYAYVAPVSWLVAYDVAQGRKHLNFSNWPRYADDKHEIWEEVSEGEMPLWYYAMVRSERRLSRDDVALLRAWLGPAATDSRDDDDDEDDEGEDE